MQALSGTVPTFGTKPHLTTRYGSGVSPHHCLIDGHRHHPCNQHNHPSRFSSPLIYQCRFQCTGARTVWVGRLKRSSCMLE